MPGPLLTQDDPGIAAVFGPNKWGLYNQSGSPILEVNSTLGIEYARDYHVSDYIIEKGGFESYNKVASPYQAKLTFLIGSSRTDFLNNVEAAVKSLELIIISTPEIQYASANLYHYSYRRTARNGVTLIAVDCWCSEIRETANTSLSNSADTGMPAAGGGSTSTPAFGQPTAGGALTTQSTNAASPVQLGQVAPLQVSPDLQNVEGPLGLPQINLPPLNPPV